MAINTYIRLLCFCLLTIVACKKDQVITSADAGLMVSADTLSFDTVFTSVGSVTQKIVLANPNAQKLRISGISLGGAGASPFAINVNGIAATNFSNQDILANDSIYLFVKITVNPNAANLPFIIRDSILINYNGNTKKVQLQAYGQNARFLKNWQVTKDSVWTAELPFVVTNQLVVNKGATLTIQKGCRIYCNATAPFVINGSLRAMGDKNEADRIVFRGDRTDNDYKNLPGGWQGLVFTAAASASQLNYTHILNAYQGILVGGGAGLTPAKLTINECMIENAYDLGLYALNSSIAARNCLISQCGNGGLAGTGGSNIILTGGGNYNFNHCTIVTYGNYFQNHKQPALFITNAGAAGAGALSASFTNSIIYGQGGLTEDEVVVNKVAGPAYSVVLQNVLYKVKTPVANAAITNAILNLDPLFDSISTARGQYNFRLRNGSPAIDTAGVSTVSIDLDGKPRPSGRKPDLGCYEKQ